MRSKRERVCFDIYNELFSLFASLREKRDFCQCSLSVCGLTERKGTPIVPQSGTTEACFLSVIEKTGIGPQANQPKLFRFSQIPTGRNF
jgi:hypothetical protein